MREGPSSDDIVKAPSCRRGRGIVRRNDKSYVPLLLQRPADELIYCPLLAQSGHPRRAQQCPLLGVKRTWRGPNAMPLRARGLMTLKRKKRLQRQQSPRARSGVRVRDECHPAFDYGPLSGLLRPSSKRNAMNSRRLMASPAPRTSSGIKRVSHFGLRIASFFIPRAGRLYVCFGSKADIEAL